VKASVLNGYDELNFLLIEKSGKKNILKVSNSSHDYFFLEAQVKILQHLAKSDLAAEFQVTTLNKKGETLTEIIVEEITINGVSRNSNCRFACGTCYNGCPRLGRSRSF
jgi:Ser/Thr protein kinase RdoA (MazF antagonist)